MDEAAGNSKTTCIDVARMAGVGVGTVSRVINHPERVSQKLRDRVMRVVQATGYRPSSAAQMLADTYGNHYAGS